MRLICYILGYILLFGGLLSVARKQLDERDVIMEPAAERIHQMSEGQSYNPEYVRDAAEKADEEVWDRTATWFFRPAFVMVAGAVLIDIGTRRKRSHEQLPTTAPKPN
jgi:hypothetical protein